MAEETARVTATSHLNNNVTLVGNMNYHFVGPPILTIPTMAQNFSTNLNPISTNLECPLEITPQDGLALWTNGSNNNNHKNNHHDMNELGSIIYADPNLNYLR